MRPLQPSASKKPSMHGDDLWKPCVDELVDLLCGQVGGQRVGEAAVVDDRDVVTAMVMEFDVGGIDNRRETAAAEDHHAELTLLILEGQIGSVVALNMCQSASKKRDIVAKVGGLDGEVDVIAKPVADGGHIGTGDLEWQSLMVPLNAGANDVFGCVLEGLIISTLVGMGKGQD